MQAFSCTFIRCFFTRSSLTSMCIPERKILDHYENATLQKKRVKQYMESKEQRDYDTALSRAIVKSTQASKEWHFEIDKAKREIFKKYKDLEDDYHPFMIDDCRMEIRKEMRRIDHFYEPLIEKEADELKRKRDIGLIHIEPEPFRLEGLDEIIPEIHRLIESEDVTSIESEKKEQSRKLLK